MGTIIGQSLRISGLGLAETVAGRGPAAMGGPSWGWVTLTSGLIYPDGEVLGRMKRK